MNFNITSFKTLYFSSLRLQLKC